jgi:tRNA modification GTPase
MISNLRHYQALLSAQTELESALIRQAAGGEIIAEHLRGALNALRELIGEVTPDDILGIIFSKFCMGK